METVVAGYCVVTNGLNLSWAFCLNLHITFQVQAAQPWNLNIGTLFVFVKFELALALPSALRAKRNWNSELALCQLA